ncbi:TetR/AcrR family transcriptional regulator [Rhizobium sp. WYJ-E13]|uniref:TetR/AcrR family transcriptional regulator n=1 Tax=Rhizobium sp. WYJ-E13 TaxID=2849093 RepID=UPI001C1EB428|nr:TetR/AcrR family transcriptional regulator [Rhizobium sp. WYJ-E13]QWW72593.1 TetR/AcrR family transcriptional regulator [Rhizobium sp. WYJ-E13]
MGRNREFDTETALEAVLRVFWRKGYEGSSYTDLTEATGVQSPSLYSAFGNKEDLFRCALVRYNDRYLDYVPEALALPRAGDVVAYLLDRAVDLNTRYPDRLGCFVINGLLAGSDEAEPIRLALVEARSAQEAGLRRRLERAKDEKDLDARADPAVLAAFVMTIQHGIAVQAKSGIGRMVLQPVVRQALSTWPEGACSNSVRSDRRDDATPR